MLKNKKNNTVLTVVLFVLAAVTILFPLYITVVIALEDTGADRAVRSGISQQTAF